MSNRRRGKGNTKPHEHKLIRIGQWSVDEVLPFVVNVDTIAVPFGRQNKNGRWHRKKMVTKKDWECLTQKDYDGHMVSMCSQRYQLFAMKGTKCVICGIEGVFFGLERFVNKDVALPHKYHFNLYGLSEDGKEILMTKDHIMPRLHGGKSQLDNYQVMCTRCNSDKGCEIWNEGHVWHPDCDVKLIVKIIKEDAEEIDEVLKEKFSVFVNHAHAGTLRLRNYNFINLMVGLTRKDKGGNTRVRLGNWSGCR